MARIRVLEAIAGADFSWAPGDVVDLPDEEAAGWADGHRATLVDDEGNGRIQDLVYGEEGLSTPRVVTDGGLELDVLAAEFEDAEPLDSTDHGRKRQRVKVTVALPREDIPAASEEEPDVNDDGDKLGPAEPAYDPREHTNREVIAYLDTVGYEEALRVLDIEANEGEGRAGIGKNRDAVLEAARARDAAAGGDHAGAEKTAEASRGGGRGGQPETREW